MLQWLGLWKLILILCSYYSAATATTMVPAAAAAAAAAAPAAAIMYGYHNYGGRGNDRTPDHGNQHEGPPWDPAGSVTFDEWSREVRPWLVITAERMGPAAQAAALQRGLRGSARTFVYQLPTQVCISCFLVRLLGGA